MVTVGALRSILSTRANQLSAPAAALYSYLELFTNETPLDSKVIQEFIWDTSVYPHWQQSKAELDKFLRDTSLQLRLDQTGVVFPLDFAIVPLQHERQIHRIIERSIAVGSHSKLRIYTESEDQYVAVLWNATSGFHISQFTNQFRVFNGEIAPLQTHLSIEFDPQLNLLTDRRHQLEIRPFAHMAWTASDPGLVQGVALKGFRFQKLGNFTEYPERLFLTIQKLQSFFLKKESHPYYQRLTEKLEAVIRSLKVKEKVSQKAILELESQVRSALEMVFVGDRLLGLLLRDVNHLLGNQEWQLSSDLTSTSPTAASARAEKPMSSLTLDEF